MPTPTEPSNEPRTDAVVQDGIGLWSGARRPLTIGLVLVITLVAFEALAVATVMPSAERELGGLRLYGWAFSAFLLASLVGITWAGEQCDRYGPAPPLAAGLALFACGLAISGLAPEMWVLVIGRGVQGLGAGAVHSVAYVTIGRGYSERLRPQMFAVLSTAWVVPGLMGSAIAGVVAEYLSWRVVFLGLLPIVLVAAILTVRALRGLGPPDLVAPAEHRLRSALQLSAGAGIVLGGLATTSVIAAVSLVTLGGALAVPALRRLLPDGTLRAASGLPAAIAGNGLLNMAFFGAEAFVPLMTTSRGQSPVFAGLALAASSITWTAGSWLQARTSEHWERRAVVRAGFVLVAAGVGGVALALWPVVPVAVVLVAWGFGGLGMGLAYPSFSLITLARATVGEQGKASSSLNLSEVLGSAIGAGVGGAIIAAGDAGGWERGSMGLVFAIMVAVATVGFLIATRLPSLRRPAPAVVGPAL